VWYIVQKISTGETVSVSEDENFFPQEISGVEASLSSMTGSKLSESLTILKNMQDSWVQSVLLKTKPDEHYHAKRIGYEWNEVPYSNKGIRSDIMFKNVI
jgi:hypothetical protein